MADTVNAQAPSMSTSELASKLDQLLASATQQYSLKNYNAAAEHFSEAAEIQDQLNGEMSPDNADLLYQYGRCLYHVAVSNSDVLGGKVASGEEPKRKKRKVAVPVAESSAAGAAANGASVIGDALRGEQEQKLAEDVVEAAVEEKEGVKTEAAASGAAAKPYFQITGDENWTDSEDENEDDAAAADAEAEEEEDDFAIAYEILDVARVLLGRKLEALTQSTATEQTVIRQLRERLADTHDLQAEISLENERFQDAIKDTRDALALKLELYPEESSLIAEAHFKLSLALEFASVTSTADGADGSEENEETKVAQVDEGLRKEAADEMEKAIASCKLRIEKEEASLADLASPQAQERQKGISDVKEMVTDMEQRLVDLRNPAVSLAGGTGPAGAPDGSDPLRGVLGAMLGESKGEQQKRIAEATETANDLSGLVKHRKKAKSGETVNGGATAAEGKGKRKAVAFEEGEGAGNGKKAKVEDAAEEA